MTQQVHVTPMLFGPKITADKITALLVPGDTIVSAVILGPKVGTHSNVMNGIRAPSKKR